MWKDGVCLKEREGLWVHLIKFYQIILIHISYLKLLLLEHSIDLYIIIYTKIIRIKKVYMFIVLKSMCFGGKGIKCHFQQYFSYIVVVRFIGGGSLKMPRKPLTCLQVTDTLCPFKTVWRLLGLIKNLTCWQLQWW